MFAVTQKEADVIRAAFEQRGELSAAVELRRLCPGISDNMQARQCVRAVAGWRSVSSSVVHSAASVYTGAAGSD
jgi:hypothetical protein